MKLLSAFLLLGTVLLTVAQQRDVVTFERLRNSDREPQNWMHYWGNYRGTHYSALKQITKNNVANLQLQWSIQLPGASALETEPLVIMRLTHTTAASLCWEIACSSARSTRRSSPSMPGQECRYGKHRWRT